MFQYWQTPHTIYSYIFALIRGGSEFNCLYITLKEENICNEHEIFGGGEEITKSPADLLSHGIHEILPLVLSPTQMPVYVKLPATGSSTGTYKKEELVC